MKKSKLATTPDAISEFEAARGLSFPPSYRAFLLAANGGRPENIIFPIHGLDLNPEGLIQLFFGLGVEPPSTSLEWNFDFHVGRIPSGIVPIACNGVGDYVCLDLRAGTDRIVFWDNRHFWSTGEWREQDLYPVADTFDDFLSLLRPDIPTP